MSPKLIEGDTPATAGTDLELENNESATERIKLIWEWMMTSREPIASPPLHHLLPAMKD
jgi:hypothetical protein